MGRNKELVKNTAILTAGKLCTQFVSFLLLPLYTALLSTTEYGTIDILTTYISLILPLVNWQLDQGLFRFMIDAREDRNGTKSIFSSVLVLNIIQCVVYVVIFIVLSFFVKLDYKWFLLLGVILHVFSGLFMQFARGINKMVYYSAGSLITASTTVFFNVLFIAVLKTGIHGMLFATLLGLGMNCIFLLLTLKVWKYWDYKTVSVSLMKKICSYSLPLVPNQISGWVLSVSDRTVISTVIGVAANGIYAVANKFSNLMATFYGFFNLAWVENVSLHYNDDDRDVYISSTINTVLNLFISATVCFMSIMPFVFPVMVNAQYDKAFFHIPILFIAGIFQITVGLYSAVYIALKKSSTIAKTTLVGAVINVLVNVLLIKYIGLYAASISTLISYFCVAEYRRRDVEKYMQLQLEARDTVINIVTIIVVSICYYSRHSIASAIGVAIAVIYSCLINWKLIALIIGELKNRLTHK